MKKQIFKKILSLAIFALVLASFSLPEINKAIASGVTITSDSKPALVSAGGQHQFVCDDGLGGSSCTWSVSGGGTIDSNGLYHAPATFHANNYSRGCQLLPQNSIFNTNVSTAPVAADSSIWLQRIWDLQYAPSVPYSHRLILGAGYYDNPADSSTPTQLMHGYYDSNHDGSYFMPPMTVRRQQSGTSTFFNDGKDHHLFTINHDTCETDEIYQTYLGGGTAVSVTSDGGSNTNIVFPSNNIDQMTNPAMVGVAGATGSWTGLNQTYNNATFCTTCGAQAGQLAVTVPFDSHLLGSVSGAITVGSYAAKPTSNAGGMAKWSPGSNAIPPGNGVDAPGSAMDATTVHMQEWWDALQQGRSDLGHAIRTTLSNSEISARNTWPAVNGTGVTYGHPNLVIAAATNASPAQIKSSSAFDVYNPCTVSGTTFNQGYAVGCTFNIVVSGFTGAWANANGDWLATAVDTTHFTIPFDSTSIGVMTGNPKYIFNWAPYGTVFRMKSSFPMSNICTTQSWCPAATVLINTFKNYGLMLLDGTSQSDNWDSGVTGSEFMPDQLLDAMTGINSYFNAVKTPDQNFDEQLEAVDTSGFQVTNDQNSPSFAASTQNRITVTATSSAGTSSQDVLLQGTAVDVFPERLAMTAGTTRQLQPWVTGNDNKAFVCSVSPAIGNVTVTPDCLITVGNVTSMQSTQVIISSVADPTARAYMTLDVVPVSSDGKIRLAFGQITTTYTDAQNNVWYDSILPHAWDASYSDPVVNDGFNLGSYAIAAANTSWNAWSNPDRNLFSHTRNSGNDLVNRIALPNGSYNVTLYGDPGCVAPNCPLQPGKDVFDVQVQGVVPPGMNDLDGYVLANGASGNYTGWTLTTPATVTDGLLTVALRSREGATTSTYGVSEGAMLITPITDFTAPAAPSGLAVQ